MQFYWFISKLVIYFLATLRWVFDEIYLQHVRLRGRRTKEEITKSSHLFLLFSLLLIAFLLLRDFYSYYYCIINRTIFHVLDFLWFFFFTGRKRLKDVTASSNIHKELYLYGIWSAERTYNLDIFSYFVHLYISTFLHFLHFCTFVHFLLIAAFSPHFVPRINQIIITHVQSHWCSS